MIAPCLCRHGHRVKTTASELVVTKDFSQEREPSTGIK
jgi:hypothetical protein